MKKKKRGNVPSNGYSVLLALIHSNSLVLAINQILSIDYFSLIKDLAFTCLFKFREIFESGNHAGEVGELCWMRGLRLAKSGRLHSLNRWRSAVEDGILSFASFGDD